MPNLVSEDDREEATSLLSTVEHVAWTLGPILAGGLLAASGPEIAYWVNAATFVLSAVIVSRIPAGRFARTRRSRGATGPTSATGSRSSSVHAPSSRCSSSGPPPESRRRRQRRRGPVRQERDRRRQPRARLPRRGDGRRPHHRQLLRSLRDRGAGDDAGLRRRAAPHGGRLRPRLRLADDRGSRDARGLCDGGQRRRDRLQPGARPARRAGRDARPRARRPDVDLLRRARTGDGRRRPARRRRGRATAWAIAGCVYLVAAVLAFVLTARVRRRGARERPDGEPAGLERLAR